VVISSIGVLFGLGLVAAAILAVASRLLAVREDPRIEAVEEALLGANCGGCGYPGCAAAAAGVVRGEAGADVCVAGGPDIAVAVAAVLGVEVGYQEPKLAEVGCTGGDRAEEVYAYEGVSDCRAQAMLHGGVKKCQVGCLGLGSCEKACPFDAIHVREHDLPIVDPEACTACGKCVEACPHGVMAVRGLTARILHLNQEHDCLAPCLQRCPGQIDIPRYIDCIRRGDYAGAVNTLRERIPLLLVCGRVCPRPCENVCRRGVADDPVGINMLKRFVADWEMESGQRLPIERAPDTGHRVAVVGGGPAGLSCAFFLRRLGHAVTIFEAKPKLGGQLRYGIPEYRLPKRVLDWEIQGILDMGIETRMNTQLGRDFSIDSLREDGYEAIFLGIGAWVAGEMRIEGEDLPGVMTGTEFLTQVGLGVEPQVGKRVVLVGGGNTAIDSARTALRRGAESVTIMYRRTAEEMPANREETKEAKSEGVKILYLAQPKRAIPGENGRVVELEYLRMELGEPDQSGRRRPTPIEGSETRIPADTVISAIGQKPNTECLYDDSKSCPIEVTRWRTIKVDPDTLQTKVPHVFAGGDVELGPALVISALGDGRKAARSIHYHITEGDLPIPDDLQREMMPDTLLTTIEGVEPIERAKQEKLCTPDRTCGFGEIESALTEQEALAESCRCLGCGLVCYNPDTPPTLKERKAREGRMTA
jgi:RnfABCDGE-type electron transport complex B subunit